MPLGIDHAARCGISGSGFDTLASKSCDGLYPIDCSIVKTHRAASGYASGEGRLAAVSSLVKS